MGEGNDGMKSFKDHMKSRIEFAHQFNKMMREIGIDSDRLSGASYSYTPFATIEKHIGDLFKMPPRKLRMGDALSWEKYGHEVEISKHSQSAGATRVAWDRDTDR